MNSIKTGTAMLVANVQRFSPGFEVAFSSALSLLNGFFFVSPFLSYRDSAKAVPILSLDEGTLINIFGFLSLEELLRACRVCRLWQRLSYDLLLWKTTDLRRFSKSFDDPVKFQALVANRLADKIRCLDLSGFILTEESLRVLTTHCQKLRVLKLKSVTFVTNRDTDIGSKEPVLFPKHLDCLDIRFSHGNARVYRAIANVLSDVKWLGLCDAFFQNLLAEDKLEATINSMKHLRKLDLSHCLLLKDTTLSLFVRCKKLQVLSVRRCSFLTGAFVEAFLNSCAELKTLILDGISLDDETLAKISWRCCSLKYLDLGWCPLVTPTGLKQALPRISRIQTLEYLGLCAIGDEKAVDDDILLKLGASLSCWRFKKLQSLNVSRSRSLTQDGVDEFRRSCSFVEVLDTTDCPAVKRWPTEHENQSDQVFHEHNNNVMISGAEPMVWRRKGSVSATQFAKSKYKLETPL